MLISGPAAWHMHETAGKHMLRQTSEGNWVCRWVAEEEVEGLSSLWEPEPELKDRLILIRHAAAGVGPDCRSRWVLYPGAAIQCLTSRIPSTVPIFEESG